MVRTASTTYERIWAVVRRIPRGRVATYGQVAAHAGFPRQPRLAGYAMHALPAASDVPWHRVLAAGGRIALRESDGHAALQRALLQSEGVPFRGKRVAMEACTWAPRGALPRPRTARPRAAATGAACSPPGRGRRAAACGPGNR